MLYHSQSKERGLHTADGKILETCEEAQSDSKWPLNRLDFSSVQHDMKQAAAHDWELNALNLYKEAQELKL